MPIKKFDSVEDVREVRKKVASEYEGEDLPSYLSDYFDKKELQQVNKEYYRQKAIKSKEHSWEEIREFKENKEKEFWEENETEIVKKRTLQRSEYDEPEIIEEEVRDETEEEKQVIISLCEDNLYLFAIRYFSHYLKRSDSQLHKYIYKLLSRELKKKNRTRGFKWAIAAPRGGAKSTIVSTILPVWCVCYKKKEFIILLSDTKGQAEDFLTDVKRELEHNVKLQRDFPLVCSKGNSTWKLDEILTRNSVRLLALGTGSKVRGRKYGNVRPDLIISDDLESSEMVRSEKDRDFIRFQWFNKDVLFAGGEVGTITDFLVVGTILGKDALLEALLTIDEYPQWSSRRFKAVIKFSTSDLWNEWANLYKDRFDSDRQDTAREFFEEHRKEMLEGTEVLWPEGDPYYDLMIYKLSNPSGFSSEKQNDPLDPTKIIVTKDQLHFENFANPSVQRALARAVHYGSIDPSLGKKGGDDSVITTLARDPKSGYLFVRKFDIKNRSVDDQIDDMLKAHRDYKYKLFGVETNAFQYVIADNLRKKSRKLGFNMPIKDKHQYQDKKMRFEGIVPLLTDGTIVFDSYKYKHNNMYNAGIEQIVTFTGENDRKDDAVDSLVLAVEIAAQSKFRMLTKQSRNRKKRRR